jgi:hypothetical protein
MCSQDTFLRGTSAERNAGVVEHRPDVGSAPAQFLVAPRIVSQRSTPSLYYKPRGKIRYDNKPNTILICLLDDWRSKVINVNNWLARANELLQQSVSTATAGERIAFATSFLAAFYGPESVEMKVFRQSLDNIERSKEAVGHRLELHARGTIKAVKPAVESGLIKSVRTLLSGEIVGDLLAIARERLDDDSESAKNVSAVLVAAAFRRHNANNGL